MYKRQDYELSYGEELTKTPKGTQLSKVRELQVTRTIYSSGIEKRQLVKETVPAGETRHTFYLNTASHGYEVEVTNDEVVKIIDSTAYYVTVEISGEIETEVIINGYEYHTTQAVVTRQLNAKGTVEQWENPLISGADHAADLAEWVGDYLRADREYDPVSYTHLDVYKRQGEIHNKIEYATDQSADEGRSKGSGNDRRSAAHRSCAGSGHAV